MTEKSLKLTAYLAIKERILNCELAPGMLLNEESLVSELNMSRTPIRDALGRLEQEGLISILPKRGFVASELSIQDINELYEARQRLEPFAVQYYGAKLDGTVYEDYYRQFSMKKEDRTPVEWYNLDDAFHQGFIQAANNRYLSNMYKTMLGQLIRFRIASGQIKGFRIDETREEHLRIAKACLSRNWPAAAVAMQEHIEVAKNAIIDIAIQHPERFCSTTAIYSGATHH